MYRMKNIVLPLFALFISALGFSQSDNNNNSEVLEKFTQQYNSGAFESIYDDFSVAMQNALPLANAKDFFGGLNVRAGKIKASELQKMQSENSAVYKTTFERGIFEIQLSLDSENKIAGFMVKPFLAASTSTVENQLFKYPEEIVDIIFANAKDFPENTQLSIAIIKDGKSNFYGVHIANNKLIPAANENKVFEIGSLTKVFTSTVLAHLVEQGKIKLTDKINLYYPFLFTKKVDISFESLANHTSGLPRLPSNLELADAVNPYKMYGVKELEDYLANRMILTKAENNLYEYSNLGAGLLGHTLSLSQKMTFEKLLQMILDKYKMNSSYTSCKNLESTLVKGLNEEGNVVSNWDFDVLMGGGGILSTTTDLVSFANAQFDENNKALALTRTQTAVVNEEMKIGLGWHLLKSEKGNDLIWHNGGTGGYSSSMVLDVQNKNGIIILSNVSGLSSQNEKIDEIGFALLKLMEK